MRVQSGTGLTIPVIVQQHVEDAAVLFEVRMVLASASHVKLKHLRRFDDCVAAHLDGMSEAHEHGASMSRAALENASSGSVFAAAVGAIEAGQESGLNAIFALVGARPEVQQGLIGAFSWVEPDRLTGLVRTQLASSEPLRRMVGVAACAMHRVDPGLESPRWLQDPSPIVRSRVLQALGELGRHDVLPASFSIASDEDADCQFWRAWSAVILGGRGTALTFLVAAAASAEALHRARAYVLALQAMDVSGAHSVVRDIARESQDVRWQLRGSGIVGDPAYVPWLIGHMSRNETTRLAGEAFCLISGADLALLDLERKPPQDAESGPTDDPDNPTVEMDPDDGLPWPDPERIKDWWAKNSNRFTPGSRYFMGAPVTRAHCIDVLKNGYQRQRILAAHYLCLLDPGTPLFNTSAPAWRQQRLLAQMV